MTERIDGRTSRGDRTREALLVAGRAAFARHGRDGASVRDIAGAAGVNPALVRYHFGSKDELYRAVIEHALTGLRDRVLAAMGDSRDSRAAATRAIGAYLDHLEEQPDFPKLVARGVLDQDAEVLRIVTEHAAPLMAIAAVFPGFEPDIGLTMFAATVVTFIYAPALARIGLDPATPDARAARRLHLETLAARLFSGP
jgi:AcrR family transcriptional regulator